MRPLPQLAYGLLALTLLAGTSVLAQSPTSKALIVDKVDENQLVTLKGNTPPAANAKNDLGRVSGNLPMTDVILVLRRSPEMQAAFDAFVASQYDATSPNYHQWLTPGQIGEKFGPALSDIATVSTWLTSHGLSVVEIPKDRMSIRFSGTAQQVETTFHTQIHKLVVKGEAHIANMSDPQIPMALDAVVVGPKSLHNFMPRPLHKLGGRATLNPQTGKWERVQNAAAKNSGLKAQPDLGFGCGSGCQLEDVAPYDFAAIYNVLPLWNASIDGSGQTIAVVGTSDVNLTDVANFKSTFGLPAGHAPIMKLAHGTDPGRCTSQAAPSAANNFCTLDDQIENSLDVEWSGAVAPGAQVELVVSGATSGSDDTVYDSASYAIDNVPAKIMNVSYGLCELGLGTSGNQKWHDLWQTASAAGIAVFAASGDAGSPACDQGFDAGGTPYSAEFGLEVSGIASTAFNTAVGGTDLNWGSSATPYWNTSNSGTNGSSAKGYMPEAPWNDTCASPLLLAYIQSAATALQGQNVNATKPTDAESACNFVVTWNPSIESLFQVDISYLVDTVGAGGGESNCTTNDSQNPSSCTGGYPTPSWQAGVTGLPTDGKRYVPDVSFFAGNGILGSAYLICVSDWSSPSACVTRSATSEPSAGEIGGTSASSPAMAGVMALINQKTGSAQGSPNAQLYELASSQNYSTCKSDTLSLPNSCYFNDVVTGTIAMPCASGSPNCTVSHSGDAVGILSGYGAGVGFDRATGLGTLNVANVVNGWASAVGTATATVSVSASPTSFSNLNGTAVTVTVTGSSGTPTGSVALTAGTKTTATKSLSSGTVTFNLSPGFLNVGTDTITANYNGDSTYASASGSTQVTVSLATFNVTASAPAAISAGSSATSTITVTPVNGYTGTVTLSCALSSSSVSNPVEAPTCAPTSGQSSVVISSPAAGTGQVTVSTTAAPSGSFRRASNGTGWFGAAGGAALASLLIFFLPGWSKRYRNLMGVVLLMIAVSFFAVGCGGGGGGGSQKSTPTVTITPAKTTISETDSLQVAIAVTGSGSTPTGSVTMTSGSYNSGSTTLTSGAASITIPLRKLAPGSDSLSVSYTGDSNFNAGTGTATVTVTKAATPSGTYTFTVTGTGSDAVTTTASTTFTVTVN
jgi:subtilase family serine protease